MKVLTAQQTRQLLANGTATKQALEQGLEPPDHKPVVKLFTAAGACTWLLTELDPDEPDIAFGLCDLGMQCPEIGSVSMAELTEARDRLGLPIERDMWFEAKAGLSSYARAATRAGRIVEHLEQEGAL